MKYHKLKTTWFCKVGCGSIEPWILPPEYKEYEDIFSKLPLEKGLPEHQPWDHWILLKEGTQPTFGLVYACSERELQVLKAYLEKSLAKGYIRPSNSPVGFLVLFTPKKDGNLWVCVDYWKLNKITIPDQGPLPRINESLDRINGAMIFTTMDIVDAYHQIQIAKGDE